MKKPSKATPGPFTLSLYREGPIPFDEPTREEFLNVLADLLREALSGEANVKETKPEKGDESEDHQ